MAFPNRLEAQKIFSEVVATRNASEFPFTGDMEKTFRDHCAMVADIAEKIAAKTAYLNSEKAYVLGLLHDCGRYVDEPNLKKHHGVAGYKLMMEKGYPDIAKVCITHNVLCDVFEYNNLPKDADERQFFKDYISGIDYDDYDLLIQLADSLNNCGKNMTIEKRYEDVSKRYKMSPESLAAHLMSANRIKKYFDEKCSRDVYALLGINND